MKMKQGAGALALGLFGWLLLPACSPNELGPSGYQAWVTNPEHGLVQEASINGIRLKLQYRPIEQVVLSEQQEQPNALAMEMACSARKGSFYFSMQIARPPRARGVATDVRALAADSAAMATLASTVQGSLKLVIGKDTLPCALAHLESPVPGSPGSNLSMSFVDIQARSLEDELKLIYNDHALGLGRVEFVISGDDIRKVPALRIS